ncbi:MAG: MobF family relaxase [Ferrimicrobium acidiphilum]
MLTLRKLSLGQGYRYLMDSIAVGDGRVDQSSELTRYYAESGTPPGRWKGRGLADLGGGKGIQHGSEVTESQLWNMLGLVADPLTGEPVGQALRIRRVSMADRIKAKVARLPEALTGEDRVLAIERIKAGEAQAEKKIGKPVAGFDLTFSPSKSVSVAWALADPETKAVIYRCHQRAIDYVLGYAEREVIHSRSGKNGVLQEDVTGISAASFTHYDSRAGDPQLHDHVIVWNRAKSISDGKWRTLDGSGLYKSIVTLGVMHEGVLSDLLTESLGVGWEERVTKGGMPKSEIIGIPTDLMEEFSQRVAAVREHKAHLVEQFTLAHGRAPSAVESVRLAQQANLETRQDKVHRSLAEMTDDWCQRAARYLDDDPTTFVAGLANRNELPLLSAGDLSEELLQEVARFALDMVSERHATFGRVNVLAEVHRQLHGLRFVSPDDRVAVAERTTDVALAEAIQISSPELYHLPERFKRADGTSRMRPKERHLYTTATLLDAEADLFRAARSLDAPIVSVSTVKAVTEVKLAGRDFTMSSDQALAVEAIATSTRRLDLLVGPAGTGKTTTMAGLRTAWELEHGPGSVIGLAPSATAAQVLADELGIETENTAKWLHEWRQGASRRALRDELASVGPVPGSDPEQGAARLREIERLDGLLTRWRFHPGQLVIIDEASLIGTFALDELVSAAQEADAKVLLVGDPAQISSITAGGMFGSLVRERGDMVATLSDVRRFTHAWERTASMELRVGNEEAIDAYETHERIKEGEREELLEALYQAWRSDVTAGKDSLMIAGDADTVTELNNRARADRVATGEVAESGLSLADGTIAGVGDEVVTRENNRLLTTGKGWVKNGDCWQVIAIGEDASMTIRRLGGRGEVTLPADYVVQHVELAYATTAYRAQGRTLDTAHAMITSTTPREVLYVAATRGREANLLYVDTHYDPDPATAHKGTTELQTGRQVLSGCLANQGAEMGAHDTIRAEQEEAEGVIRLQGEYDTIARIAQEQRWDDLLERSGLTDEHLVAIRQSPSYGPLLAALRGAEARGLDIERDFPVLATARQLDDVEDVAAVLANRVTSWTHKHGSRRMGATNLIAGLIPKAMKVSDPDLEQALHEREAAIEQRARVLVERAMAKNAEWIQQLGETPTDPVRREVWLAHFATVAAYRERWHVESHTVIGKESNVGSIEQLGHWRRANLAIKEAARLAKSSGNVSERSVQIGTDEKTTIRTLRAIER